MTLSARKKMLIGAAAVVVLLLGVADEYPAMRLRGDGKFFGVPVVGYYEIKFQKIPLNHSGEYTFHFRGMPREEMRLLVGIERKIGDSRPELRLENVIEARLSTENDQTVCEASASPLQHGLDFFDRWVPMEGTCEEIRFNPRAGYILHLSIRDVDPRTPAIILVPEFEAEPDAT